jgi:3-(methylthio)propanoyl-CoA dehydrogenase
MSPIGVTIIHHPGRARMLMTMKAQTEAMRALAYVAAAASTRRAVIPDPAARARGTRRGSTC